MKPEQLDKLEQLQDKLLTVAVDDCGPENWTGYGQKTCDMDRETRGNAIYDRKLAGQTLACFGKSTILAVYNAWCFYQNPQYRILHQSETDGTARKTSRDTQNVLRKHPLTKGMLPER